ncbi:MAG: McrC family protein [Paraclostridium bifermentans]|uniref:McrC family protein n=1 Tax=Paraclostridium bifermentans TaxID=1490 RepID=UPI001D9E35BD|nr:McrC family protein [Paraclostridium bifermentans]MBS6508645.1 McrC family protein [Paraclostridium bifermentans]
MRHITIYECYDNLKITNEGSNRSISIKEADELNRYIESQKLDNRNIIWSRDDVIFINYVGFIKLSTVSIEILPKVNINSSDHEGSRKSLLNMLSKSGIINFNYSNLGMLSVYKMDLNEILALIFAKTLQSQLIRGPYLEYINVEENSKALKGSLLVKEHIKNISRCSSDVFCKFEEFSIDNTLNQIFNTCIRKTIKNVKNSETLKILSHINVIFSEVSYIDISNKKILDYKFSRLNSRFEPSLLLAKMLLNGYSSIGNKGDDKSFAILFEMNDVYERYITNLLRLSLDKYEVHSQHSNYKLLKNEKNDRDIFLLQPDIVIEVEGKEKLIIDTKWKKIDGSLNRHGVKRDDFYQMYAYLTRYEDVKSAILLYPSSGDSSSEYLESWYLEHNKNKKIRVYEVSLYDEVKTLETLKNIVGNNI